MLIRDKNRLVEVSDIMYEDKENRFVFKDARCRTLAKLTLANPSEALIDYTIKLMAKWFITYGYVDIYKLNQEVDDYKEEPIIETKVPVQDIPIVQGFDTPIIENESILYEPNNTLEQKLDLNLGTIYEDLSPKQDNDLPKKQYLNNFLMSSMMCKTIEEFKELIEQGNLLGVTLNQFIKETSYLSRDLLISYMKQLNLVYNANLTREDMAKLILSKLN